LREVETTLRSLAAELKAAETARAPLASTLASLSADVDALRSRKQQLSTRLAQSTGGAKELASLTHELEVVTTALSDKEDLEIAQSLEVDPLDEELASIRRVAQPLVEQRTVLQAAVAAAREDAREELARLNEQRTALLATVPTALLARYEQLRERLGVTGAALVNGGKCDGCRMALAPLDLDRLARESGSFLCPECGRILLPC
jgi:predicted  nucleic acid-binding Zn-ribbon protein